MQEIMQALRSAENALYRMPLAKGQAASQTGGANDVSFEVLSAYAGRGCQLKG